MDDVMRRVFQCGTLWYRSLLGIFLKQVDELENKGIVFKARWFVQIDITQARPLFKWNDEGIARVISRKNNGLACVSSGHTNQTRIKNNTFILILKHF